MVTVKWNRTLILGAKTGKINAVNMKKLFNFSQEF